MAEKKKPVRMCVGCREMKPKIELIRVVKTPSGEIFLDKTGKLSGRGAYICKSCECLKRAKKTNSLARSLETAIDDEIYQKLGEEIENA